MTPVSLKEIKSELGALEPDLLINLCLHLAKYKRENKELLTYLLFNAHDENEYIRGVKVIMDEGFVSMNLSNVYLAKKTLRKVLRIANKFIKYSGLKKTEVELLIYFCKKLKATGIAMPEGTVIANMYVRQVQKIKKSLATLHEDLQFDYSEEIELL